MLWAQSCLVLVLIGYSFAANAFYKAKVGDRVVLDLGPRVYTWQRVRSNETKEVMTRCLIVDTRAICHGFLKIQCECSAISSNIVFQDGQPAIPPSNAQIDEKGRLIINPVVVTDSGSYLGAENIPSIKFANFENFVARAFPLHVFLQVKE
uniref:Peptidase A1 domain-containing protein n=1 Tax=Angiostrongylus cantonensis TaxID=6313 RepID=A0A0K0D1F5_ANGCA